MIAPFGSTYHAGGHLVDIRQPTRGVSACWPSAGTLVLICWKFDNCSQWGMGSRSKIRDETKIKKQKAESLQTECRANQRDKLGWGAYKNQGW